MSKWWKKMYFWTKLRATIASVGIGSEITLFMIDSNPTWKIVAVVSTIVGILITTWIEDKDNDGVVDIFQTKKRKPNE